MLRGLYACGSYVARPACGSHSQSPCRVVASQPGLLPPMAWAKVFSTWTQSGPAWLRSISPQQMTFLLTHGLWERLTLHTRAHFHGHRGCSALLLGILLTPRRDVKTPRRDFSGHLGAFSAEAASVSRGGHI